MARELLSKFGKEAAIAAAIPNAKVQVAPMITTEAPTGNASNEEISDVIDRFGVQLIAVPDDPDGNLRPYVYTIGFHKRGMPELIAFADDEAHLDAFGELLARLARRDRALAPGERLRIGEETLVAAIPDADFDDLLQEQCLTEAKNYYGISRLDLLVIVSERELNSPNGVH